MWLSAQIGASLRRRRPLKEEERDDFGVVQAATLTLLGLIIGFSFSMAVSRYDLRKNYEEAEAHAIGTEYVRNFRFHVSLRWREGRKDGVAHGQLAGCAPQ